MYIQYNISVFIIGFQIWGDPESLIILGEPVIFGGFPPNIQL